MKKFLGETVLDSLKNTPYSKYTEKDWALEYITSLAQIDGSHHKTWVLDQATRILYGTPVIVSLAKWDDGTEEYRYVTGEPSQDYLKFVEKYQGEYDEENEYFEYDWDVGVAP
jgi:hypothetical protein